MMATLLALAQAAPSAPTTGPAGPLGGCGNGTQMVPFVLIFVVFYFLLIRPQQKKQREQQDWLKSLKKGDEVFTSGGIIGKISGLTENTVTLEVQEKVRIKVLRSHIAGKAPQPGQPAPEPEKK
jgi:preprotein translocase subunit YajC